jgi:hypothetical protein
MLERYFADAGTVQIVLNPPLHRRTKKKAHYQFDSGLSFTHVGLTGGASRRYGHQENTNKIKLSPAWLDHMVNGVNRPIIVPDAGPHAGAACGWRRVPEGNFVPSRRSWADAAAVWRFACIVLGFST